MQRRDDQDPMNGLNRMGADGQSGQCKASDRGEDFNRASTAASAP